MTALYPDTSHRSSTLRRRACSGNPGPGGWAYILRHWATAKRRNDSGAERHTTNNRMELPAVIRGLEASIGPRGRDRHRQHLRRQGLLRMVAQVEGQRLAAARRRPSSRIKNEDLWRRLDRLAAAAPRRFTHVRGHAGHPENELATRRRWRRTRGCRLEAGGYQAGGYRGRKYRPLAASQGSVNDGALRSRKRLKCAAREPVASSLQPLPYLCSSASPRTALPASSRPDGSATTGSGRPRRSSCRSPSARR